MEGAVATLTGVIVTGAMLAVAASGTRWRGGWLARGGAEERGASERVTFLAPRAVEPAPRAAAARSVGGTDRAPRRAAPEGAPEPVAPPAVGRSGSAGTAVPAGDPAAPDARAGPPGDAPPGAPSTVPPAAAREPARVGAVRPAAPALDQPQREAALRAMRQELAAWRGWLRPAEDRGKALAGSRTADLTLTERTARARAAMADEAARAAPPPGPRGPRADDVMRAAVADAARRWGGGAGGGGGGLLRDGLPGGGRSRRQRARDAEVEAEVRAGLARMAGRMRRRADSLAWVAESTGAARAAPPS